MSESPLGQSLEGLRILVLDDEALVLLDHSHMIELMGGEAVSCVNLPEAYAAIEAGPLNAALLDVNSPAK